MKYCVFYCLLEEGEQRLRDCAQDDEMTYDHPPWIPVPGDTVQLNYNGEAAVYSVRTRHFDLNPERCHATIVIERPVESELPKRIHKY